MEQYLVSGMTCAACQTHVEKAVCKLPGVTDATASLLTNTLTVQGQASPAEVMKAVDRAGYRAKPLKEASQETSRSDSQPTETGSAISDSDSSSLTRALEDHETPRLLRRLAWSLVLSLAIMYISMGHSMWAWPLPAFLAGNMLALALTQMLLALAVLFIGKDFFVSGFKSLAHLAPNMDSLVALGSSISFLWSLGILFRMTSASPAVMMDLYHHQLYFEGSAMILTFITVGKTLESLAKGHTTDALKSLLSHAPQEATVEGPEGTRRVPVSQVKLGDIIVVKPGEAIPVDAVVVEGSSTVDESALSGESAPVSKEVDSTISAATLNQTGFLKARATRIGADTTFSQIVSLVSDAAGTKAPVARIADKVSSVFVPVIIAIAALVLVLWLTTGHPLSLGLSHAVAVLLIACPCALGLATPVAIMVGNGLGARSGILFKSGQSLEEIGRTSVIALDKTGTVTEGRPQVVDIVPVAGSGVDARRLLSLAASLEAQSEHPYAQAILRKAQDMGVQPAAEVKDFHTLPGKGLEATVGSDLLYAGNAPYISSLLEKQGMEIPSDLLDQAHQTQKEGKTPLFFASPHEVYGFISVADGIKADSAQAIRQLHEMGLTTAMITGDNERTAQAIASQAGIDHVVAGVLPQEKEAEIVRLQQGGRKVAMVGDGINDAPALARADVGVAIGAGTDVAIDAADVVLMDSRLTDVAAAVRLSRATVRNIHENLFWAFAYNLVLIPIAAGAIPGWSLSPMWAAAAMGLSSVTVCLNALRLNLYKVHPARKTPTNSNLSRLAIESSTPAGENIGNGENTEKTEKPGNTGNPIIGKRIIGKENAMTNQSQENQTIQDNRGPLTTHETVHIDGMSCAHCEMTLKKALEALDGVSQAELDHTTGTAQLTLSGDVQESQIRQAIEDKDYTFVSLDRN
ncbi:MAG: heavy metal translocating P-type ATPase [Parascardovia denticolens]